jgi:hypothetical protein
LRKYKFSRILAFIFWVLFIAIFTFVIYRTSFIT